MNLEGDINIEFMTCTILCEEVSGERETYGSFIVPIYQRLHIFYIVQSLKGILVNFCELKWLISHLKTKTQAHARLAVCSGPATMAFLHPASMSFPQDGASHILLIICQHQCM